VFDFNKPFRTRDGRRTDLLTDQYKPSAGSHATHIVLLWDKEGKSNSPVLYNKYGERPGYSSQHSLNLVNTPALYETLLCTAGLAVVHLIRQLVEAGQQSCAGTIILHYIPDADSTSLADLIAKWRKPDADSRPHSPA
jgi:hypothetical protein